MVFPWHLVWPGTSAGAAAELFVSFIFSSEIPIKKEFNFNFFVWLFGFPSKHIPRRSNRFSLSSPQLRSRRVDGWRRVKLWNMCASSLLEAQVSSSWKSHNSKSLCLYRATKISQLIFFIFIIAAAAEQQQQQRKRLIRVHHANRFFMVRRSICRSSVELKFQGIYDRQSLMAS